MLYLRQFVFQSILFSQKKGGFCGLICTFLFQGRGWAVILAGSACGPHIPLPLCGAALPAAQAHSAPARCTDASPARSRSSLACKKRLLCGDGSFTARDTLVALAGVCSTGQAGMWGRFRVTPACRSQVVRGLCCSVDLALLLPEVSIGCRERKTWLSWTAQHIFPACLGLAQLPVVVLCSLWGRDGPSTPHTCDGAKGS